MPCFEEEEQAGFLRERGASVEALSKNEEPKDAASHRKESPTLTLQIYDHDRVGSPDFMCQTEPIHLANMLLAQGRKWCVWCVWERGG